jgi:hypothetical protein
MERSPELETLVGAWFQAASTGDASLVDQRVSQHPATRLIGSDPEEWHAGEAVAEFLRGEVEGQAAVSASPPPIPRPFRRAPWAGRRPD